MGVYVQHGGQHPLAGRVDDLRAVGFVEIVRGHRDDVPVPDADVADRRRGAGAIELAAVADDRVVAHQVIEQGVVSGVNEIREQIPKNVYWVFG